MKHGKYSKTKEVKPWQVINIIKRYDGICKDDYYFSTKEKAEEFINYMKQDEPKANEYYYGQEFKINFIGAEKKI